jgi:hydrogenase small subunit
MATPTEFIPNQAASEAVTAHVLWITAGQSCEGDSVAMTSASNPSLEDIIQGVIPGMPRVVIHNGVVPFENGQEFIQAWFDAEQGKLDPFVLVIEGSLGNEQVSGDGFWTGSGSTRAPTSRSPSTSGSIGSPPRRRPWSRSAPARPTAVSRR